MTTETPAPAFEPDVTYIVSLAQVVTVFGGQLLPLHRHEIQGAVLNSIVEREGAHVVAAANAIAR